MTRFFLPTSLPLLLCFYGLPSLYAIDQGDPQQEAVVLRLQPANVPGPDLAQTRFEVKEILRQVNVRVIWKMAGPHEPDPPARDCDTLTPGQAIDISTIDIQIQDRTRANDHPGALAYSMPFARSGVRIVVFYDRVLSATNRRSPVLLAHVIAHEVGHMLMGTYGHAPSGLMHDHWSGYEMIIMQKHPLQFTPMDVQFIAQRFRDQHAACAMAPIAGAQ